MSSVSSVGSNSNILSTILGKIIEHPIVATSVAFGILGYLFGSHESKSLQKKTVQQGKPEADSSPLSAPVQTKVAQQEKSADLQSSDNLREDHERYTKLAERIATIQKKRLEQKKPLKKTKGDEKYSPTLPAIPEKQKRWKFKATTLKELEKESPVIYDELIKKESSGFSENELEKLKEEHPGIYDELKEFSADLSDEELSEDETDDFSQVQFSPEPVKRDLTKLSNGMFGAIGGLFIGTLWWGSYSLSKLALRVLPTSVSFPLFAMGLGSGIGYAVGSIRQHRQKQYHYRFFWNQVLVVPKSRLKGYEADLKHLDKKSKDIWNNRAGDVKIVGVDRVRDIIVSEILKKSNTLYVPWNCLKPVVDLKGLSPESQALWNDRDIYMEVVFEETSEDQISLRKKDLLPKVKKEIDPLPLCGALQGIFFSSLLYCVVGQLISK